MHDVMQSLSARGKNRYLCKRRHIGDTTLRAFNINNFLTARGLLLLSFKSVCKIIKKHEKYKKTTHGLKQRNQNQNLYLVTKSRYKDSYQYEYNSKKNNTNVDI